MSGPYLSSEERGLVRRIVSDSLAFRRSAILPWQGLRVAIGTAVALAVATAIRSPAVGAAAGGGSLGPGLTSLDPGGRTRFARAAVTTVAMGVATFVGSATASVTWLHVLLTGLWAAGWGLLAGVEPATLSVGVNAVAALLVFGRFPSSPLAAAQLAGVVAAGGGVQLLLAATLRRIRPERPELRALTGALAALSGYARSLAGGGSSLPSGAAIEAAAQALRHSPVVGETREAWESLVDETERVRLLLLSAADLRDRALRRRGPGDPIVTSVDRILDAASVYLAALASALSQGRRAARDGAAGADLPNLARGFDEVIADLHEGPAALDREQLAALAHALAGQLRGAGGLLPDARARDGPLEEVTAEMRLRWLGRRDPGATAKRLLANLSWRSSALRHAVRLAAVVSLATLIGHLTGMQRGYWIGLTAVIVLRPEFGATFSRGVARAIGTLVGVGIASLIALTLHLRGVSLDIAVGAFTAAAASLLYASFAGFSVALTGAVVFLLATIDTSPVGDAEQRLLATLIGSALALAVYAVWPSWSGGEARRSLVELIAAERAYVAGVLRACAQPSAPGRAQLAALERALRLARTNAEAAISQSSSEPSGHRLDPRWSGGVLAALRRTSLTAHTLRARLAEDGAWPSMAALLPLASAVDGALAAAGTAVQGGRVSTDFRLRPLQGAIAEGLGGDRAESDPAAWVVVETDEMVDALDTLLHLVSRAEPAS